VKGHVVSTGFPLSILSSAVFKNHGSRCFHGFHGLKTRNKELTTNNPWPVKASFTGQQLKTHSTTNLHESTRIFAATANVFYEPPRHQGLTPDAKHFAYASVRPTLIPPKRRGGPCRTLRGLNRSLLCEPAPAAEPDPPHTRGLPKGLSAWAASG
jgi:hypothetical protein